MEKKKLKKVYIVIEETGQQDGKGFQCYLQGDIERIGKTDQKDLTPAEFYGQHLFRICADALKKSGAHQTTKKMDTSKH